MLQRHGSVDDEVDQLIECVQHPGHVMYMAGGWGYNVNVN